MKIRFFDTRNGLQCAFCASIMDAIFNKESKNAEVRCLNEKCEQNGLVGSWPVCEMDVIKDERK